MRPVIEQISGELMNGSKFKFARVRDIIDNVQTRQDNDWTVKQFQEHVMSDARNANGGQPTFVLELSGLARDPGVVPVRLNVPDNVDCPEGSF
jgi:hypothetical protein